MVDWRLLIMLLRRVLGGFYSADQASQIWLTIWCLKGVCGRMRQKTSHWKMKPSIEG